MSEMYPTSQEAAAEGFAHYTWTIVNGKLTARSNCIPAKEGDKYPFDFTERMHETVASMPLPDGRKLELQMNVRLKSGEAAVSGIVNALRRAVLTLRDTDDLLNASITNDYFDVRFGGTNRPTQSLRPKV